MADISTDRLEPMGPAVEPAGRQNRNDPELKPPRRPPRRKPNDGDEAVEGPPHEVDQMA